VRDAIIWFNSLCSTEKNEGPAQARVLEELELEKLRIRHMEEEKKQIKKIETLTRLEEHLKKTPSPLLKDTTWKELHGKVKVLNQILQLENLYAYCQDERFHDRLSRFEPALADMGLTIPLCLEAVQEIPELVSKRKLTIAPENGGATYKVSMIDTRGSGR